MMRMGDAALRRTSTAILHVMIADGTCGTILARDGLLANAVPEPVLNVSDQ